MVRWFGHEERMEVNWLMRLIGSDVRGVRLRGRPRMEGMDDVKLKKNVCGARKEDCV